MDNAQADSFGVLGLALGPASLPVIGITLLVDPGTLVMLGTTSDAFGGGTFPWPIAANEMLGLHVYGQVAWLDACGPELFSSSRGVEFTVVP